MLMKDREWELIASLLGDAEASRATKQWLTMRQGRRELAAYRRVVRLLNRAYGSAAPPTVLATVHYTALSTPIGRVFVAATNAGLVRVSFRQTEAAFTAALRRWLRADVATSPTKLAPITRQLDAYFRGGRRTFDLPLDLSTLTAFQRRVLQATRGVPAGKVVSYGEIARRIGCPRGSRAVGQALGSNPVPIVIPCHRVISGSGNLGGYTGGLHIKKRLLQLEGVRAA